MLKNEFDLFRSRLVLCMRALVDYVCENKTIVSVGARLSRAMSICVVVIVPVVVTRVSKDVEMGEVTTLHDVLDPVEAVIALDAVQLQYYVSNVSSQTFK